MSQLARRSTLVVLATFLALGLGLGIWWSVRTSATAAPPRTSKRALAKSPIQGERALGYLQALCDLGPRTSGSPGMEKQQKLIGEHFQKLGAEVHLQRFRIRSPVDGSPVVMGNLIAQWHPEAKERVMLCVHYDTRPFPDRDPRDPRGVFLGANDGASGAALLMELAHQMKDLDPKYGVDFVLFDGEEFVFQENGIYFYGSEYFARDYATHPPEHRYRWAVLVDMIGDADLQVWYEAHSIRWPDSRPLTESLFQTAAKLGIREFVPQLGPEVRDDHVPLHDFGRIPSCDLIDFNYPYWHTTEDTPDKCSGESLAKVGTVLLEWLKKVP
jgi:hypothetical protein